MKLSKVIIKTTYIFMAVLVLSYLLTILHYTNNKARIDILLTRDKDNYVEMISSKTKVNYSTPTWLDNPKWLKEAGKGSLIEFDLLSNWQKQEIKLKSIGSGKMKISFRAPYLKNDKKRNAQYVDYKNIYLNGKMLKKDAITITHDKPFIINNKINNGDEVSLIFEAKKTPVNFLSLIKKTNFLKIFILTLIFGIVINIKKTYWLKLQNKININILFIVILCPISLFCVYNLFNDVSNIPFFWQRERYFLDYWSPIYFILDMNPFVNGSQNPPLLNYLYYIFSLNGDYQALSLKDAFNTYDYFERPHFFIYSILIFIFLTIWDTYKQTKPYKYSTMIILLTTISTLNIAFIGNPMVLVVLLSFVYFLNYNSQNKILREIAFISLGLAAGLKLYPCLFGLLTLYNKNWKETARLALYGVVFTILPFLLFKGGFNNIWLLIENNIKYNKGYCSGFSLNWLTKGCMMYGGEFKGELTRTALSMNSVFFVDTLITYLNYVVLAFALATNSFLKDNWKKIMQLMLIILSIVIGRAYPYFGLYLFLPLIMFLNTAKTSKLNLFYMTLFICMFNSLYTWIDCFAFSASAANIMLITITIESSLAFIKSDKKKLKSLFNKKEKNNV